MRAGSSVIAARAILAGALLAGLSASAQTLTPDQSQFFENKIRPILVNDCYKCHSSEAPKLKGGLSLETRQGWVTGGDTGPAIVPGDPDHSLLIKAVRYTDEDLQMPPKGAKLSDEDVAVLVTWVKMGAPDPRVAGIAGGIQSTNKAMRDHWAFKPIQNPPVPQVTDPDWVKTPIDAFILAKLETNGMKPNPPADKRTLIRRATFDLIGLPPTQDEIRDFLADNSPDAFAKVVDRLLASPQYGERWGRIWLDTARYSDTKGDVKNNQEDYHYPYAWTYRDYVVRSFNEDKPFNRFILEQIAADKLATTDMNRDNLAAMGFLTVGERFNESVNDIINDRIDVVTKGFLGLTVTCARCHDHKFDPIPTRDYYSLRGVFASCAEPPPVVIGKVDYASTNYQDYVNKSAHLETELLQLEQERKAVRGNKDAVKKINDTEAKARADLADLDLYHPDVPARAMILVDKPKPQGLTRLHPRRGRKPGRHRPPRIPADPLAPEPHSLSKRQRSFGTGRGHRQRPQPAHQPRDREPCLAAPFRCRHCHHAR